MDGNLRQVLVNLGFNGAQLILGTLAVHFLFSLPILLSFLLSITVLLLYSGAFMAYFAIGEFFMKKDKV